MSDQFTPVAHVGEFGLIYRMGQQLGLPTSPDLITGIGDDAAVYRVSDQMSHVVTTDALVEGVHFDRGFAPLSHLGRKAIAVNVSDVVAMNARPRFATVAIGMPRNLSVEMVETLYAGMAAACEEYGLEIIGGDTTAAPQLTLSITVIGEARTEDVIFRRGANPGDLLCVSGDVGAAFAGLQVLLDQRREMKELGSQFEPNIEAWRYVIARQLTPRARMDAQQALRSAGIRPRALIDVSDGVASEVHHLCAASQCGAIVDATALPVHPETRTAAAERMADLDTFALFGGEDYELLFAIEPEHFDRLDQELFSVIGEFVPLEEGVSVRGEDGHAIPLNASGYDHFEPGGDGAAG
ncbi:MAG: thiamine-phosphate kinase [Rhodothermales bacterium]|nr:thiamine-phosphate kinase [Rhodothermales bacterium]MBO6779003.1 thiamine-phosphate kinase [Rhodothermales bacterium]